MNLDFSQRIDEAAAAIRREIGDDLPRLAVVLGSGLGELADRLTGETPLPYDRIPHFPRPTAAGHAGRLVVSEMPDTGQRLLALQGRFHQYEGHSPTQAALPVWVLRRLGVETLVVTNAAGGLNPAYRVGEVMLIEDQINLMFRNPLVGVNDERLGPRLPDMSAPYDRELIEAAESAARREGFACPRGVYVGMLGPTYETRAEYRMCRRLGGDAVGMSTVPEAIAAAHSGMRLLGVSTITNACSPDQLGETTHEEVVAAAASAQEKVRVIVEAISEHATDSSAA